MTAAQDAAVLYFALHGTDAPLTCQFIVVNDRNTWGKPDSRCGETLAGLDHGDGCPLCAEHVKSEGGHLLSEDVLAELWLVKRTWETIRGKELQSLSALESFTLRVAGIDPTADTERPPPPSTKRETELRLRGHLR